MPYHLWQRLSVIAPVLRAASATREGDTAIVAPRRSSSSHAALRPAIPPHPHRMRAEALTTRTACGTARPTAPCRSGTWALASHARGGESAPDSGASETSKDLLASERQARPSRTGTAHPAARDDRSRLTPPARLVGGHRFGHRFLARADFRWLVVAITTIRTSRKTPANGPI